jgi:hypothetical protein
LSLTADEAAWAVVEEEAICSYRKRREKETTEERVVAGRR